MKKFIVIIKDGRVKNSMPNFQVLAKNSHEAIDQALSIHCENDQNYINDIWLMEDFGEISIFAIEITI